MDLQTAMGVHYSSQSDEWETPPALFAQLHQEFGFTLDPCATADNHKCARYYTLVQDGLQQTWAGEVCYMNPPYGHKITTWVAKAYQEQQATIVALLPARTDTRWWHSYVMHADELRFIQGRVRFVGGGSSAPFPSVLAIFRPGIRIARTPIVSSYQLLRS